MVLGEDGGVYAELADRLAAELGRQDVKRLSAATLERDGAAGRSPDVVVALGTRAFSAALRVHSAPLVAALVPMENFDHLLRTVPRPPNARGVSGVYLDQPIRRRLNLARLAFPDRRRIGVLLGPDREGELKQLRESASAVGLGIVSEPVSSAQGLYPALARLLTDAEVLLALPDAAIFNSGNIHNILLATYRARVPVLGFSAAYVQAGALAAVYSTPRQIAPQLAELAQRALAGRSLPPPQFPRAYKVGVNDTVARSLGLVVDDGEALEARMAALEAEP